MSPEREPRRASHSLLRATLALVLAAACRQRARPPVLAEALLIEQPGGSAAQLFAKGSELPASATESFTTAHDGEARIVIRILRGAGHASEKLHRDGLWLVDGVRPAKAGEPEVLVTFELDARGGLKLSAREADSRLGVKRVGERAGLDPSPLTEPLDDEEFGDEGEE